MNKCRLHSLGWGQEVPWERVNASPWEVVDGLRDSCSRQGLWMILMSVRCCLDWWLRRKTVRQAPEDWNTTSATSWPDL